MKFSDLGILPELEEALAKESITAPMPVQTESAAVLMAGKNAYVSAETGTGKTLAFLLPLLSRIDLNKKATQILVAAPTHELAIQIQQQVVSLTQNSGLPIRSILLIGGTSTKRQLEKLKKKPQIAIGSPGRMLELLKMKKLKAHEVQALVVDEADRLMFGDSEETMLALIKACPSERQLVFVSATAQSGTTAVVEKLCPGIEKVSAACNSVNENIKHLLFVCEERDKPDMLRRLIRSLEPERAIVFAHRNKDAELIAAKMANYNIPVADLHGTRDKEQRKMAMQHFRTGKATVLIASDIAARGLDIKGVTHIFNYDIPSSSKDYLHRVGRTGRAGKEGVAVSLMTEQECRLADRYEADLSIEMIEGVISEGVIYEADYSEDEQDA